MFEDGDVKLLGSSQENAEASVFSPLIQIDKATIVADHTLRSFSLYEIVITAENKQWTILRRYSWFRALHTQLLNEGITLEYEFPPMTYWIGKLDPEVVESRKKGLEVFLNRIIANKELLEKEYITSFFLPVRCFTTFIETNLNFRAIKESRICFIDFLRENDTLHPQIKDSEVDYDKQHLWQHIDLNQLQGFEKAEEEILEIRKELLCLKRKKRLTALQEEFVRAYSARLKMLKPKKTSRKDVLSNIEPSDSVSKNYFMLV